MSKAPLVMLLLCVCIGSAYTKGATAVEETKPHNGEWVLAITSFNVSTLPSYQQTLGDVMTRNLMSALKTVSYRSRMFQEYAYYADYAWSKDRAAAAKTLAAKREERDMLLFQGYPEWQYKKNLKTIEEEIKKLEAVLQEAEIAVPLVADKPVFKFTEDNNKGVFPARPKAGGEYRFCVTQKADAFLQGDISLFHGRLYLKVRMYTLYSHAFQYEDSIIFSIEDSNRAVEELVDRLVTTVAGTKPAAVVIHGNPQDALVLINGSVAGRGEIGPLDHAPGSVEIESFADTYQPLTMPLDLNPGELAELYLNLQPLSREALTIQVPAPSQAQVYQGALYLGQTPLPVEIDANRLNYFELETPEGEKASVIIQGSHVSTPDAGASQVQRSVQIPTRLVHSPEEQRVEKTRKRFYGAYGRFWIALPLAYVIYGVSAAQISAYNMTGSKDLYDQTQIGYYVSLGAMILAGVALTETFYRIFQYVRTGNEKATLLVK